MDWRREPYRVLFPVGALLAVLAVLPFPLRSAGGGSLALFHSSSEVMGFLTCFALGFLFTLLPRLTRTAPPDAWELAVAVSVPPVAVASAWGNAAPTAYVLWLGLAAVALVFTIARLRMATARGGVPAALLWIPASWAAGAAGAVLAAGAPLVAGSGGLRAWVVGRGLLVQGLVGGLVLGAGALLLPAFTRGEPLPAAADHRPGGRVSVHLAAAALFFASFPLEVFWAPRPGLALRAAVATAVLALAARAYRPPTLPGVQRRLVWLGAWLVPAGFWAAAIFPRHRAASLHVVFVGGFALLALAAATHVAERHGAASGRLRASPAALRLMAALLVAAFAARLAAALDLAHIARWLSWAALAFTGAVAAWGAAILPPLLRARGRADAGPAR